MFFDPELPVNYILVTAIAAPRANVPGNANRFLYGVRIDITIGFQTRLETAPSFKYRQFVRTVFTKRKRGVVTETIDTGLHDDNYSIADGTLTGGVFCVSDDPGIDIALGEQLDYGFFHKQYVDHSITGQVTAQTPGHTFTIRGTFVDALIGPQLQFGNLPYRYEWRPTFTDYTFRTDLDF